MDGNGINRDDIVGTTDYLEAITVFKATKNFLFVVTLFGLVLMLASFFVANSQYASFEGTIAAQRAASEDVLARGIGELAAKAISHVEEVTAATEQHGPNLPRSAAMTRPVGTADDAAHAATEQADANEAAEAQQVPPFRIKFQWIAWVLRVGSFAGIITTTLYSMMLAFCLTISLVGRLGGINHIARAFVWSLAAMVFLLPWQRYFGGVIAGAVFTPTELMDACTRVSKRNTLETIFFYTRYVALPLAVVFMMIVAQIRSGRWAKATLRRLGVM